MVTPVQQMLVAVAKVAPLWDGSMGTLWDGGGGSGGAADAGGSGEVCPTTAGYWAEPAIGQSAYEARVAFKAPPRHPGSSYWSTRGGVAPLTEFQETLRDQWLKDCAIENRLDQLIGLPVMAPLSSTRPHGIVCRWARQPEVCFNLRRRA